MRDDGTKILLQSGCVLLRVIHPFMGKDVHSFTLSIHFFSDGLDIDLPLACPGKQSCTETCVCWRVQAKPAFVVRRSPVGILVDQQVMQSCSGVFVGLVLRIGNAEQSSETFLFKCLYPAFCVRSKRPCLAAVEKDWSYDGLEVPVRGGEADGNACPQPAQSGHRCGRHGNSYD